MPIFTIPASALQRIIIGMHFGGLSPIEMSRRLSHKYPALSRMQPDDISVLFEHQRRIRSLAWTQCTEENTAQSPTVRRVLMDMPGDIKRGMGGNENEVVRKGMKGRGMKHPEPEVRIMDLQMNW